MLTPRELEVLDVVGEVMQERLQEVRKEYEGKLTDLQEKVAALEARPEPDVTAQMVQVSNLAADALTANMDERFKAIGSLNDRIVALETRPLPDVAPLTEKIAALEERKPEVTVETLRAMGDDIEEVIERRLAMLPPPPDLTPLNEKFDLLQARGVESHDHLVDAIDLVSSKMDERLAMLPLPITEEINTLRQTLNEKIAALEARPEPDLASMADMTTVIDLLNSRIAEVPPPVDLAPLTEKVAGLDLQLKTLPIPDLAPLTERVKVDHTNLENLHERVMAMETKPPVDLAPLAANIALLEEHVGSLPPPITAEEVLTLAQGALTSTRASLLETLQISMVDLFKALPIPEKGEKGDNGTGVTVEQFRDMFEASYARFELETERRIMDLVQRTLDRVPIPQNGKDGFGFDDFEPTFDGERTLTFRFVKDDRVKEFPFTLPYPIDKSVWKADTHYARGDGVSWGGSWWIAQRDDPGKPDDGEDCGWRLAVKTGRDGRSAYDLACARGFKGSKDDWLLSLKGEPGKTVKTVAPNGTTLRASTEP